VENPEVAQVFEEVADLLDLARRGTLEASEPRPS